MHALYWIVRCVKPYTCVVSICGGILQMHNIQYMLKLIIILCRFEMLWFSCENCEHSEEICSMYLLQKNLLLLQLLQITYCAMYWYVNKIVYGVILIRKIYVEYRTPFVHSFQVNASCGKRHTYEIIHARKFVYILYVMNCFVRNVLRTYNPISGVRMRLCRTFFGRNNWI